MNCINEFPIDDNLKELIANTVITQMEKIGFERTENSVTWFCNECSAELIENILESIVQWERKKLN